LLKATWISLANDGACSVADFRARHPAQRVGVSDGLGQIARGVIRKLRQGIVPVSFARHSVQSVIFLKRGRVEIVTGRGFYSAAIGFRLGTPANLLYGPAGPAQSTPTE